MVREPAPLLYDIYRRKIEKKWLDDTTVCTVSNGIIRIVYSRLDISTGGYFQRLWGTPGHSSVGVEDFRSSLTFALDRRKPSSQRQLTSSHTVDRHGQPHRQVRPAGRFQPSSLTVGSQRQDRLRVQAVPSLILQLTSSMPNSYGEISLTITSRRLTD